ncbi:MAG TPA: YidB family protein [Pseudolabrys sp.]|nr:YidB family protein [Pseudolabrys sp.]
MGLLDQFGGLKGVLGSMAAAEGPAVMSALLAKTNLGSLQGIVDQLQQGGLGDQVKSWLSDGPNMKVTPDQVRAALGSDEVRQIAQRFGIPVDDALKMLADHLPGVVDQASPNGKIQRM